MSTETAIRLSVKAEAMYAERFRRGCARSPAYHLGFRHALRSRVDCQRGLPVPYVAGSTEFDAFCHGHDDGVSCAVPAVANG